MDYTNLIVAFDGPIGRITVNRPAVLNALDAATLGELKAALWEAWNAPDCRAVVLTGAGPKAFVAGADIAAMAAMSPSEAAAFAELGHTVCGLIERMPRPVIAAVNGFALGGGCELALACDVVLASENAVFGQPEVKLGIIPGFGGTARLARAIGRRAAMEWILGGGTYPAAEAHRLGLVGRVVPREALAEEADRLARTIASRGPLAVATAKRLVHDGLSLPQDAALRTEALAFANLFDSADQKEGMAAFLAKREAAFTGR
jgi:enoyl-CoA hydratase